MFTIQVEAVFNTHPHVQRTALVGIGPIGSGGNQTPIVVVEQSGGKMDETLKDLELLARSHEELSSIQTFLSHGPLPVDVRHNSKINRELLAKWTVRELGTGKLQPGDDPYNLHSGPSKA